MIVVSNEDLANIVQHVYKKNNQCLFPNRKFKSDFEMDIRNYSKSILIVPKGSLFQPTDLFL